MLETLVGGWIPKETENIQNEPWHMTIEKQILCSLIRGTKAIFNATFPVSFDKIIFCQDNPFLKYHKNFYLELYF